jgi:predicted deacylase
MPVGVVKGAKDGPTCLVTGGLLATEYCGIEAASRLYNIVKCNELSGTFITIPVVNLECFQFNTPWFSIKNSLTPVDGLHINRCFPGDNEGTATQKLAYILFNDFILSSDYHIDFRGGDLHESHLDHTIYSVTGQSIDKICEEMAKVFGLRYVLPRPSKNSGGTLIYESVKQGIPSIISESGLGYRTQPLEKYIQLHINGALNVMKHYNMLPGDPEKPESQEYIYDADRVTAPLNGIFHAYFDQGDFVEEGEVIGKLTDLKATTLAEIKSPINAVIHEMLPKRLVQKGDIIYSLCSVGEPTNYV